MFKDNLPGLPCPNPHFVRGGLSEEFRPPDHIEEIGRKPFPKATS
jgi:hypothetical protein